MLSVSALEGTPSRLLEGTLPKQQAQKPLRPSSGKIYISRRPGAFVYKDVERGMIVKQGNRVKEGEEVAMILVAKSTDIPIPQVFYDDSAYLPNLGILSMSFVSGCPLSTCWNKLDDSTKRRLCLDIWDLIAKLRTIPKPPELSHLFQCSADGSPTTADALLAEIKDVRTGTCTGLVEDLTLQARIRKRHPEMSHVFDLAADDSFIPTPTDLIDDDAVRARIYQRYLFCKGRKHAEDLPDMLPKSTTSVFTHGDIAPRNIMVDDAVRITGLLDWESAGWYPDYWEYANLWKPAPPADYNWKEWMDRTAPRKWDIRGIQAARRVLF